MSDRDYESWYEPSVRDDILSLPREHQRLVARRCGDLARDPRPTGFEKLEVGLRMTFHSYRITFWVDDASRIVTIARVSLDPAVEDL